MNFLYPHFLFGLAAIAIPIIIHLFDFRRTKKVYFSNTKRLHQVKESTKSFYNLKHLLILFSRIFFITALVLAFAQPYFSSKGGAGLVANRVGIFIDNSLSMSNNANLDESGLALAKSAAIELIDLYPAGTEFIIQSSYDEKSAYLYRSKQEAKDYTMGMSFASDFRSIADIAANFKRTHEGIPPSEIVMISDFQSTTLMSSTIEIDTSRHYILAPILFESTNNLVVDTAFISNPFELDKTKTNLVVRIKNYSPEKVQDIPVKLFLGDRQLSVTSTTVPEAGFADLNINIGYDIQTETNGRVVIEDYPIAFDNELFFALGGLNKVKVTSIRGDEYSPNIAAVFGNEALFDFSTTRASNINFRNLEDTDLIILNQVEQLGPGVTERLNQLRIGGTAVLVIPGTAGQTASFENLLPRVKKATVVDEMPLQVPDFSRPFYENIVENVQQNMAMPSATSVWQWGGDRNALLKYIDGRPFLSETESGLFVLAAPLQSDYTNFQLNALFVPVMYRIAANSRHSLPPLFHRLNEQEIDIDAKGLSPQAVVKLANEDFEFIPDQRLKGKRLSILLPGASMKPGHYSILNDQFELGSLALNLNTAESDVSNLTEAELSLFFEGFDYSIVSGGDKDEIITKIKEEYQGIELWRYFLGLALVFLFIEALLIRLL